MTPKKRILFVDDEPAILSFSRLVFENEGTWDVSTAASGEEAFSVLRQQPVDVILSDMRMPGMSGAELLRGAMELYPKASRIIMSGYSDAANIAKALGATHQFVAKPFQVKDLIATINRICALDELLLNDEVKSVIARMRTIPSLPSLYYRICSVLESPDSSIEEVAAIVAEDPSMTAKMLQLVNSPFFGYSRKISSAVEAVSFLGMSSIRTLAISSHMVEAFRDVGARGFSLGRVWNHSMATALAAQKIARFLGGRPDDISNAYTAGMLHDIGKLMMASNLPGEYSEAVGIARSRGIPMAEAEREVFGASHAEIGAYLLGLWGLPVPIVEAVAFHHRMTEAHLRLLPLVAVHTASALENKMCSPADKLAMQTVAPCIPEPLIIEATHITREALNERMRAQAA